MSFMQLVLNLGRMHALRAAAAVTARHGGRSPAHCAMRHWRLQTTQGYSTGMQSANKLFGVAARLRGYDVACHQRDQLSVISLLTG
jgi:hypothetical protein